MAKFIIKGNKDLSGKIKISGSKNAALALLAASILSDQKIILRDIPKIRDVEVMLEILNYLGSKIEFNFQENELIIDNSHITFKEIPRELACQIRGSVLLIGPLLFRFGRAVIYQPGGCAIGARPISTHIEAFKSLGADFQVKNDKYLFKIVKPFLQKPIVLNELSVTASEALLMYLAFSGNSEVRLISFEPEVVHLGLFLEKLGAKFIGLGTPFVRVLESKPSLRDLTFQNIPDRIEAATYMVLLALSDSKIEIENVPIQYLDSFLKMVAKIGIHFDFKDGKVSFLSKEKKLNPVFVRSDIYPNFPTDCVPLISVLLTQCRGQSFIFETMYEGRLNYLKELGKMGADFEILSPHLAIIKGPSTLHSASVKALDLRSGAALVLAALFSEGTSYIQNIEVIERGYENIEGKLKNIGAEIKKVED